MRTGIFALFELAILGLIILVLRVTRRISAPRKTLMPKASRKPRRPAKRKAKMTVGPPIHLASDYQICGSRRKVFLFFPHRVSAMDWSEGFHRTRKWAWLKCVNKITDDCGDRFLGYEELPVSKT